MESTLWQWLERVLAHHRKSRDATAIDTLNRLFKEQLRRDGATTIPRLERETCSIRKESWNPEELRRLIVWHPKKCPRSENDPVVAVEYGGKHYMVDGSNRANKWRAESDPGEHEVIVITPS